MRRDKTTMTIDELSAHCLARLEAGLNILPDKGDEDASGTLLALWLKAAGQAPSRSASEPAEWPELTERERDLLDAMITDRLSGKPLAYIIGRQVFMDLDFAVNPAALIPRKETELLAAAAIEKIASIDKSGAGVKLIDVCTGMGNLAISFASRFSDLEVLACDLSIDALTLARSNSVEFGVEGRILFADGDLLDPFDNPEHHGTADIIVCNPPYVPSAKVREMPIEISSHEPEMAFNGGELGINIILKLIRESEKFLKTGGWLVFEIGAGQGNLLRKKLERSKVFSVVDSKANDEGVIRVLMARK